MSKPSDDQRGRVKLLNERLNRAIPTPRCELHHTSPWQLLVATILSAQSTDATVNKVTPGLFARLPTPRDLAEADAAEVEELVRATGFYRSKTKLIQGAARTLLAEFAGEVPRDLDSLQQLPGVARKTANVVLGVAFGIAAGIVVDTHVLRVAGRLGLTQSETPEPVERELCALFARSDWIAVSHRLLLLGRYVCKAKKPRCEDCALHELCPSASGVAVGAWTARADRIAMELAAAARPAAAE